MQRNILSKSELDEALTHLEGWIAIDKCIKRKLLFENFADALSYVNKVGEIAEDTDHHPDICFGWGYAEISLTTHDRGGVTDLDIALAARIDAI